MIKHAQLEEDFTNNCLENGVKIIPLDDEDTTEEQRKTILELQVTTAKIVRIFTSDDQEMYQKLMSWKVSSSEFTSFMETIKNLNNLMEFKLFTPKEEVDQIKKNQRILDEKVSALKEQYDLKKKSYDEYVEDCRKSKEQRDANIKALKEQIQNVRSLNEQ